MTSTRELVSATIRDAQAATRWVSTREDTLLFAGPMLHHPWTAADLLATHAQGWDVYALHEDGRPVGVGSLRPIDGRARLGRLLVDPASRGQGLGRSLVTLLLARARDLGYDQATLGVYGRNHNARHLYESLGFVEYERRTGPDGWTSIQMAVATDHRVSRPQVLATRRVSGSCEDR